MRGKQSHAALNDGNDIPDREAMRWSRRLEDPGSAIWYKDTGPWWTERFNRDSDGVSVAEETGDPRSLLSYYRHLLALRRSRVELREGDERIVTTDRPSVLAVVRATPAAASLLLVNLSDSATTVTLAPASLPPTLARGGARDLINGTTERATDGGLRTELPAYGVKLLSGRGAR